MHIQPENLHYEGPRRFYWTRVHVTLEDGSETVVLVGAGANYISDHFRIPGNQELQQTHMDDWLQEALVDIAASTLDGAQPVHYKIYAQSPEGQANGFKFLSEEVIP